MSSLRNDASRSTWNESASLNLSASMSASSSEIRNGRRMTPCRTTLGESQRKERGQGDDAIHGNLPPKTIAR